MGIQEFKEIRDYVILCIVLMFLEDKEEQEQFLLSELIEYVGVQLRKWMEVDWNSFSQRKSMVRVLLYAERLRMLRVYDGNSEMLVQMWCNLTMPDYMSELQKLISECFPQGLPSGTAKRLCKDLYRKQIVCSKASLVQ